MRLRFTCAPRLLPLLLLGTALAAPAQKSGGSAGGGAKPASPPRIPTNTTPSYSTGSPIYVPGSPYNYPTYSDGVVVDSMLERLRRQQLQKQIKQDAERLIVLTSQYQAEVKSTGPTAASDKRLKEIEKLARDVRTSLVR